MDSIIRAAVLYVILWALFRISGKRTLSQMTTFDFILLLIISETTQEALTDSDHSFTNSVLLILTLLFIDIMLSIWKTHSPKMDHLLDGAPLVILEDGRPDEARLRKARIDTADILTAARETQGLERLDQIKYAVLERSGGISIIPKEP